LVVFGGGFLNEIKGHGLMIVTVFLILVGSILKKLRFQSIFSDFLNNPL